MKAPIQSTPPLLDKLDQAWRQGVPLIAVRTADQPAVIRQLATVPRPVVLLDAVRGLMPLNEAGNAAADDMLTSTVADKYGGAPVRTRLDPSICTDPVTGLQFAGKAPRDTLVVLAAGDRALAEPRPALAALWLRDTFASTGRQLVALGPTWAPAAELGTDVHVIDDPMPTADERRTAIRSLLTEAGCEPSDADMDSAVTYTRGLDRFTVDQVSCLSLTDAGLQLDVMRATWRAAVDRTKGLRVESDGTGGPSLDDIAGHEAAKEHCRLVMAGADRPEVIVWIDELEKCLAGASGPIADTSGASQAVLQALLTGMEQDESEGMIVVGSPGAGKSLLARALGGAGRIPVLQLSPGLVKGSLVGETEAAADQLMRTLRALGGRCYWVGTSNGLGQVPGELLRRFTDGVWFADLPTPPERAALWRLYLDRAGLADPIPDPERDRGYAGADVRNVVRRAARHNVAVAAVMAVYAPASASFAGRLVELRNQARGSYLSTTYPGLYRGTQDEPVATPPLDAGGGRRIRKGGPSNAV